MNGDNDVEYVVIGNNKKILWLIDVYDNESMDRSVIFKFFCNEETS